MACCNDFTYTDYVYTLPLVGDSGPVGTILGFLYIFGIAFGLYYAWRN